ncbi:MAG: hypothetical protein ACMXYG_05150 [Candidatus Woesearchaeota archaeon]
MSLSAILLRIIIFIVSSIPLYFSVRFLGGKTTLLKTAGVVFIGAIVFELAHALLRIWAGIIAFILMIAVYAMFFEIGWFRSFFAWLLQFIFIIIFYIIIAILFVNTLGTSLLF